MHLAVVARADIVRRSLLRPGFLKPHPLFLHHAFVKIYMAQLEKQILSRRWKFVGTLVALQACNQPRLQRIPSPILIFSASFCIGDADFSGSLCCLEIGKAVFLQLAALPMEPGNQEEPH